MAKQQTPEALLVKLGKSETFKSSQPDLESLVEQMKESRILSDDDKRQISRLAGLFAQNELNQELLCDGQKVILEKLEKFLFRMRGG